MLATWAPAGSWQLAADRRDERLQLILQAIVGVPLSSSRR